MRPSEYYENVLASITDETERRVFAVLSAHVGEQVSRASLIALVHGINVPEAELGSNRYDRINRKCIENLRSKDFPIVSTAGEAGYCLTDDPDAINRYVAEERSRIARTEIKINHLLRSKNMAHDLHQWRQGSDLPVQARIPGF